jgi:hypothetical protein
MRTHATSRMWETSLQNCQILENLLGNIEFFLLLKSNFPQTKFNFLQRLFAFFNSLLLSLTAFQFSSTAFQFSSMAFLFPRYQRKSIYGGKYMKDHHSSFVFPATCSPSFVIATRSPSFVIAPRSPSFVIATMPTSHPTHTSSLWMKHHTICGYSLLVPKTHHWTYLISSLPDLDTQTVGQSGLIKAENLQAHISRWTWCFGNIIMWLNPLG